MKMHTLDNLTFEALNCLFPGEEFTMELHCSFELMGRQSGLLTVKWVGIVTDT